MDKRYISEKSRIRYGPIENRVQSEVRLFTVTLEDLVQNLIVIKLDPDGYPDTVPCLGLTSLLIYGK